MVYSRQPHDDCRMRCPSQYLHAPGGGGPGPRHRGKKILKALKRATIRNNIRMPGRNEMSPTGVTTISDEDTPMAASTREVLRHAPIPPATTARLWGTSHKRLTCGKTHLGQVGAVIQPLVSARSNPAIPATTIRMHAKASIFRNPNAGIAIPKPSATTGCVFRRPTLYARTWKCQGNERVVQQLSRNNAACHCWRNIAITLTTGSE